MNEYMVFSILKCEFGWNGVMPESMPSGELEWAMLGACCASSCADKLAVLLAENGATFRERIDGKPNWRRVVGGVVQKRAA